MQKETDLGKVGMGKGLVPTEALQLEEYKLWGMEGGRMVSNE